MGGAEPVRTPFGAFLRDVADEGPSLPVARINQPKVDRSAWRRLFKAVNPIARESLRSITVRSCRENHLPNSFGLLQPLGLIHRNRVTVSESGEIDPAELAYAMRVDEEEVLARRYDPLGRGHVSFFGLDVNVRRIETAVRRFSPTAFAEHTQGPRFHRASWELRDVPFCLEHWDMLQHACFCERGGVVQRWSRTATRVEECDRCGDPLATLVSVPVPPEMRPALGILAPIVLPNAGDRLAANNLLPEALRQTDRSKLFRMIVRLADAVDPEASGREFEDAEARLAGLHSACDAMRRWPGGFASLQFDDRITDGARRSMREAWNRLGPQPQRLRPPAGHSDKPAKSEDKPMMPPWVGIRKATEIARLSADVLNGAWNERLVTPHQRGHGSRLVPAFDPAELIALGEQWRGRRRPDSLACEIGLPRYGVCQSAALDCIAADAPALPGTGPHFTPGNVEAFLAALDQAQRDIADPIALRQVMKGIGGRLKPWGPALRLMLDGELAFGLSAARRLADGILIDRADASRIADLRFDEGEHAIDQRMTLVDALEVLNATFDASHLLDDLHSEGKNPRIFEMSDVLARATDIVTIAEIAVVLDTDPATAWQRMHRAGIARHPDHSGAWPRSILQHIR